METKSSISILDRERIVAMDFALNASHYLNQGHSIESAFLEFEKSPLFLKIPPAELRDEYHTMEELYNYRMVYNACLFNEWYALGKYEIHKSIRHNDGELCFGGGWFIVVAILPTGQITNHYELKYWNLFQCEELDVPKYPFDGHTPQDVLVRLTATLL